MIIEGAVAHLASSNVIREGFEDDVAAVRTRLHVVNEALEKLPAPAANPSKEELQDIAKQHKLVRDNLLLCEEALARIEARYGLSESERLILSRIVAQKQAELQRMMEAPARSSRASTGGDAAQREKRPTTPSRPSDKTPVLPRPAAPSDSTTPSNSSTDAPANPTPPATEEPSP